MADGLLTQLEQWLRQARLPADGRIPAERVLAVELGVSRAELRKALASLEADGRLVRHVGRGSFLRPPPGSEPPPASTGDLARGGASAVPPRAVIGARLALEPTLARLAAYEASDLDLDRLDDAIGSAARATSWTEYDEADLTFHRLVAELAGNPLLLAAFDAIADAWRATRWGALRQREHDPRPDLPIHAEHEAIRAALVGRDPNAAEAALRHHLMVEAATLRGGSL